MTAPKITCPTCEGERWQELDDWLIKQLAALYRPLVGDIMAGRSTNDPQYRQQLGQHQAYMRVRSFISGGRKAEIDNGR